MDTGKKMRVVAGDGGVKLVKLRSKGSGNELVLTQDNEGEVNGLEVTEYGKGRSGGSWGRAERDFQDQVVGGRLR